VRVCMPGRAYPAYVCAGPCAHVSGCVCVCVGPCVRARVGPCVRARVGPCVRVSGRAVRARVGPCRACACVYDRRLGVLRLYVYTIRLTSYGLYYHPTLPHATSHTL
jgi:hypothetical protein